MLSCPSAQPIVTRSPPFFLIESGVVASDESAGTLLLHDREGDSLERLDAHLLGELPRDLLKRLSGRRLGLREHDRGPLVGVAADRSVERDLAEERDAQRFRRALRPAVAEQVIALAAVRADVRAHVLHDAEEMHLRLL